MTASERIARRTAEKLGMPALPDGLASVVSGAELKSLLMHVTQVRSRTRTPADIMRQARRDATVVPCAADLRALLEVDRHALAAAAGFEAVDLSMLQPVGTCTALGDIDQNNVLATIAATEVVADPTNAMALEAARRRERSPDVVRLCTSQRVLRMQPFDNPKFSRHFRLFAAVTAGRDRGSERFEMEAMREHLELYLRMLASLADAGFHTRSVSVDVTDLRLTRRLAQAAGLDFSELARGTRAHAPRDYRQTFADAGIDLPASIADPAAELRALAAAHALEREVARLVRVRDEVFAPLARSHRGARFGFAPLRFEGAAYYADYCFRVYVDHPELGRIAPGDGGFTTWTARLLGNRKERLLASAIGSELLCKLFAPGP